MCIQMLKIKGPLLFYYYHLFSTVYIIIIIFYFENVAFLHAKLGSDRLDNQTSGDTLLHH